MDSLTPLFTRVTAGGATLDVVNFAFAVVAPDGSVYLPPKVDPARLHAVVGKRLDNPGLKVVLSIGGWGAGNFSEAVASEASR